MKCSICNTEGHNKRTCKLATAASVPNLETETAVNILPLVQVDTSHLPSWYTIPEVHPLVLLKYIKTLYDILEGRNKSKSTLDPFAKDCWKRFYNSTEEEWQSQNKIVQKNRSWTMAWGTFHQNIMGSFPGWENYGRGHTTGCDIGKNDGSDVREIKNGKTSMNSGGKESVNNKLKKQITLGKKVVIVIVNYNFPTKNDDGITWMSGNKCYQELSGRPDFMDCLKDTVTECFAKFETYESLKAALA